MTPLDVARVNMNNEVSSIIIMVAAISTSSQGTIISCCDVSANRSILTTRVVNYCQKQ